VEAWVGEVGEVGADSVVGEEVGEVGADLVAGEEVGADLVAGEEAGAAELVAGEVVVGEEEAGAAELVGEDQFLVLEGVAVEQGEVAAGGEKSNQQHLT